MQKEPRGWFKHTDAELQNKERKKEKRKKKTAKKKDYSEFSHVNDTGKDALECVSVDYKTVKDVMKLHK
jgi:hypothetical protein